MKTINHRIIAREMVRDSLGIVPAFPLKYTKETLVLVVEIRKQLIQKLNDEIEEIKNQQAPECPGPFVIRGCIKAISGPHTDHYLYITRMDSRIMTPHKQDAVIWKTAKGAEKAMEIYGRRFGYPGSYRIVPLIDG